jgi:hypothetical protein
MQHLDSSGRERLSHLNNDLIQAIQDVKYAMAMLAAADPDDHEGLREQIRESQYVLWMLLAEPLMRVAAGWTNSGSFEDLIRVRARRDALEALAMGMFLNIIEALPSVNIDPERNVLGLLLTIARRGIARENRQIYQRTPRRPTHTTQELNPLPGTRDASMAPPPLSASGPMGIIDGERGEQIEPVDPASLEIEESLLRACHHRQCWDALQEWMGTLSRENLLILKARWFADPPSPYEDIVQMLGAGWTTAAARRRLSRLLDAAAEWLREQGLLE